MAQSRSDVFSFLITPEFDTKSLQDSSGIIEKEVKDVAEKISNQIESVLNTKLPSGFQKTNINEVTKFVESLGGSVKRVGTTISASFKDAAGNVNTFKHSIADAVEAAQQAELAAAKGMTGTSAITAKYGRFKASSVDYTGSEQIQQQNQLEQQIIKSIQEQYNYRLKIIDAQNTGNKTQETYYTGLQNIAKQEEANLQKQYSGSQDAINAKKQQLSQEEQLYAAKSKAAAEENKLVEAIKQYAKQYQTVKNLESKGQQGTQAYKDAQSALASLTSTLSQYGVQVVTSSDGTIKLVAQQNSMADSSNKAKKALDDANGSMGKVNTSQNSLSQSIQSSVENFIKYQVAMEAINKITSEFTSAIYDMNSAMAQVRMVTMGSYEDTVALADSYTQLAKQLGTTTTEVAKGADTWLRQGYSAQDAMEMLKQSTTLAVVGQLDAEESTNALTAVTKSYNVAVEDTSRVVDKLVSVDLNYAASTGEIATALGKTANSAQQAGVGLDKLIGLIAISEEKTRQSAEVIGSAWQSIISRITKIPAKTSLDDLVDENGKVVATVNDADKVLSKYGINLVDTSGKMRDVGTVLDEIGAKWNTMSTLEQNQLAYVVLSSHNTK